jgi:hypothetical protein
VAARKFNVEPRNQGVHKVAAAHLELVG